MCESDFHTEPLTVAVTDVLRPTYRLAGASFGVAVSDAEAVVGVRVLCHVHTLTRSSDIATSDSQKFFLNLVEYVW